MALLGAAPAAPTPAPEPTPAVAPGPQVAPGVGYQEQLHVDLHSIAKVKILGSDHTVPTDMHLKVTLQVKVLAVSGGRASRVELTYAKVDAPGRAGAQERKMAGRPALSPGARPRATRRSPRAARRSPARSRARCGTT